MMDRSIVKYCNTCNTSAEFYCNGCNRIFCPDHANEHQLFLYEQVDWLTVDHDDFVRSLHNNDFIAQKNQSLKKLIDKWEEESIKHIQKTADEARCALINAIQGHINDVKEKLELLTKKLHEFNQNHMKNHRSTFDERNIKLWATELHNVKHEFLTKPAFTVRIHANKPVVMPIIRVQPDPIKEKQSDEETDDEFGLIPLKTRTNTQEESTSISSRSVDSDADNSLQKDDCFHRHSAHVNIIDHGQLIVHDSTQNEACISGHHEYSRGEHKLLFHVQHMTANEWIFFGIMSKHATLTEKAYIDPSAHGWAGYNRVYMSGKSMMTLNGYCDEMKLHDIIELTIDCNKRTLSLWHSRQKYVNTLPVDIRTCPFPWKLLISLHDPNDSIRILPSSMSQVIKREQDKLNKNMTAKEISVKGESEPLPVRLRLNSGESV